jgi:hypothetical protein
VLRCDEGGFHVDGVYLPLLVMGFCAYLSYNTNFQMPSLFLTFVFCFSCKVLRYHTSLSSDRLFFFPRNFEAPNSKVNLILITNRQSYQDMGRHSKAKLLEEQETEIQERVMYLEKVQQLAKLRSG